MDRTLMLPQAEHEIKAIKILIPKKGVDSDIRAKVNQEVRDKLPTLCNDAIAHLALINEHELSWRELYRRIESHKFNSLSELFRLVEFISHTIESKNTVRLTKLAVIEIERVAITAEAIEVAECIRDFRPEVSMVCGDLQLHLLIKKKRQDWSQVVNLLNSMGVKIF